MGAASARRAAVHFPAAFVAIRSRRRGLRRRRRAAVRRDTAFRPCHSGPLCLSVAPVRLAPSGGLVRVVSGVDVAALDMMRIPVLRSVGVHSGSMPMIM